MKDFYEMESFYVNEEKKEVEPDLFGNIAANIASDFVRQYTEGNNKGKYYCVSRSQIRRLFNEVKRFDIRLEEAPERFNKYISSINMIISKVGYNVARAIDKKPSEKEAYTQLSKFMSKGLSKKLLKDANDYHVFAMLFEAVYGFYYKESIDKGIKGEN